MSRSRLSALDEAFLALESPQVPLHVGWAALFSPPANGPPPSFEALRAHIEGRLGRAPLYRQKLVEVPLGLAEPVWVDDPDFDIAIHVRRAGHADFGQLVNEVMSTALADDRPLWELWISERLENGQLGVVGKAHHCLVDGLAAVELMALLLDPTPEPEHGSKEGWRPAHAPGALGLARAALGDQLERAIELGRRPLGWARSPRRLFALPGQIWRTARAATHTALPPATESPLNGPLTSARHLAFGSRPFEDLSAIKRRFGTTVNDVLLAASAAALRRLAEERSEPAVPVKAMVPVSVGDPGERWGNRIAFLFLTLPCDEPDPLWRLRDVHVAMRERKRGGEPDGAEALLAALSYAPRPVRRLAARTLASPQVSNLTISNIPGPRVPMYLLGCEAQSAFPVVPLTPIGFYGEFTSRSTSCSSSRERPGTGRRNALEQRRIPPVEDVGASPRPTAGGLWWGIARMGSAEAPPRRSPRGTGERREFCSSTLGGARASAAEGSRSSRYAASRRSPESLLRD